MLHTLLLRSPVGHRLVRFERALGRDGGGTGMSIPEPPCTHLCTEFTMAVRLQTDMSPFPLPTIAAGDHQRSNGSQPLVHAGTALIYSHLRCHTCVLYLTFLVLLPTRAPSAAGSGRNGVYKKC